jgi:hypothetical protein
MTAGHGFPTPDTDDQRPRRELLAALPGSVAGHDAEAGP